LLTQMKGSGVYSDQVQGTAAALYRGNEEQFYKDFGCAQLIQSIKYLRDRPLDFDNAFPVGKPVEIYPSIVLNEKAFNIPFMTGIFQEKINMELQKEQFPDFDIKPITLIHVADIENMKQAIADKIISIWD